MNIADICHKQIEPPCQIRMFERLGVVSLKSCAANL